MAIGIMLVVAALVVWRRTAATRKPIQGSGLRLLVPLLFLLPGFSMFSNPQIHNHLTITQIAVCVGIGLVMSIPMIVTTNYEVRGDGGIYARKSIAFVVSLIILIVLRLALRDALHGVDNMTMTMMMFIVGVSYLVPWRTASFFKYRAVRGAQLAVAR